MFSAASNISGLVNTAFLIFLVICVVLLVLITFLMVFFVIKYGSKRHPTPSNVEGHTLLEIVWTVIPTIIVVGMFFFGWVGYKAVLQGSEDAMKVRVTGRMWAFQFTYENGVMSDQLRLPVGTDVKLTLVSADVLHSIYIPAFRVKQDLVPGKENLMWVTPVKTGTFDIFCAEYCGDRHSYMYTNVIVMEKDAFDEWLAGKAQKMDAGDGGTAAADTDTGPGDETARLIKRGSETVLEQGCIACHTLDGTATIGPSLKGLFGSVSTVATDGRERKVAVDEEYLRRSILEPEADLVKGFKPLMPSQKGLLTEDELAAVIAYIKSIGASNE